MEQIKIDRINELARLSKERALTAEEAAEQAELRKEYIELWKKSVIDTLENTYIVDEEGNKKPLAKKQKELETKETST